MKVHQRQVIREAVAAALLNKTAARERVYETRMVPYDKTTLPAIAIYALSETTDPDSIRTAPRELKRTLHLVVEVCQQYGEDIDDKVDDLAAEVEALMDADPMFGGVCSDSFLAGVEIQVFTEVQRPVGTATLTYSVTYFSVAPVLEGLDDFRTADVQTSLENKQSPADQAHDVVALGTEE